MCVQAPLAAPAAAQHEHGSDCERLCPLPEPVARSADGSECSLAVDNSLLVMSSALAMFPAHDPAAAGEMPHHDFSEPAAACADPGLVQTTPPPRA
jgi:hypothetical protein